MGKVTGAMFVDLSAAYTYETVSHSLLLKKVYDMTKDHELVELLKVKYSEWRIQKDGLPQGSVIVPIIFNVYTNG